MSLPSSPSSPSTDASSAPPAAAPGAVLWADPAREAAFHAWLGPVAQQQSLKPATLRLASADASFRRYLRLDGEGRSVIVMDAPPDKEDCKPFVQVAALMAEAGLLVPQILAWDEAHGFLLLSDLGPHTMMALIQAEDPPGFPPGFRSDPAFDFWPRPAPGAAVEAMYREAIDHLVQWQLASRPGVLPVYDPALLRRELSLFPDWYLAKHRGVVLEDPAQAALRQTLNEAFDGIVATNFAAPQVFVHRDFMPRNLMAPTLGTGVSSLPPGGVSPALGRPGGGLMAPTLSTGVSSLPATLGAGDLRLGVLDFQDAVYGPVTYDIASLMRDAFLSWDEGFVLDITVRYWQKARKAGLLDFEGWSDNFGDFYRHVELMGLQRHLKVAGIFARLTLRDGKPKYLADTPRFIGYIRATAARYRELTPLLRLIDQVENIQPVVGYAYGRMS